MSNPIHLAQAEPIGSRVWQVIRDGQAVAHVRESEMPELAAILASYSSMVEVIDDLDVAFVCTNICDDLTPQARAAVGRAWAKVQAAILQIRPESAEADAIKSSRTAYSLHQLLAEYRERRNDSKFDLLWDEFDQKVEEALR